MFECNKIVKRSREIFWKDGEVCCTFINRQDVSAVLENETGFQKRQHFIRPCKYCCMFEIFRFKWMGWGQFLPSNTKLKSLVLFPLTDATSPEMGGTHWILITCSIMDGICRYFDSKHTAENYRNYGIDDFCSKIVAYMDAPNLHITRVRCPQQKNHNDCGV